MSTPHSTAVTLVLVYLCWARGQVCRGEEVSRDEEVSSGDTGKRQVLEALKTGILSSLGMDQPPVVPQKASQEELWEMQALYQEKLSHFGLNSSQNNGRSTVLLPRTVLKLSPGPRTNLRRRPLHWHRAEFTKIPSIQEELSLIRAQLYMSRQVLKRAAPKVKVHIPGSKSTKRAMWTDITANGNTTQSLVLDVSAEVQKWIREGVGPFVVDVRHKGADYSFNISLKLTHDRKISRTTRSVKEEEDCDERDLCCRQSMTVSFKDIGWTDWVVAPLEYTMFFCQGSCPHNYKPASMHTQVKSRLAQISKAGISRPCCVPAAYEPMVLMHYDSHGKLKLTPFEDLIVSKCHCA
ncbi:hypothetical protein WMY93_000335 [Mugilogobius chulae]|uniref:TGF-beta family profile domain-containing protein n=1 Tax=Mugilogobius chulae TaxID=88201 RepID=A0AAW0Q9Q3_9GOBI